MAGARCRSLEVSIATAVAAPLHRPLVGVGHLPLSIKRKVSSVMRQEPHRPNKEDRGPEHGTAVP